MPQNDLLKRYLDAGLAFTAVTQARAEALVKDLVKAGEVQADQARDVVTDLIERSRKNSEKLIETVRDEVKAQITNLGLASKGDLDKVEARLATIVDAATAPVRKATAPVRKAAAKAAPAKKTTAKKPAAKKTRPRRRPRRRRPRPRRPPPRSRPEPLARRRLDAELVRRDLAPSRQQAQELHRRGPGHRGRGAGDESGPAGRRRRAPRRARPAAAVRGARWREVGGGPRRGSPST